MNNIALKQCSAGTQSNAVAVFSIPFVLTAMWSYYSHSNAVASYQGGSMEAPFRIKITETNGRI